ncbi:MAG: restriction endonuclease subunit S [Nitrobacter sp.]|uniref:restriction endonuclease subunit S n=1 Tax=Nitrobacter sp. TaxID=29420 RepID=UPI00262994E7|nr:restriction endonuclease subunit S [Nitrobacter sp.]MCV0387693.1 restriction endonuclease subunit S [Nitrobacter sp.]
MADLVPLQDLLIFTRDGEWGKGEAGPDLVKMAVIRGTDFSAVRYGDVSSAPVRYIPKKAADRKTLRPGDILIETAGGTKDQPTGRTVYLNQRVFDMLDMPATCASFARFLRVNRELVDPNYLYWYLQSIYSTGAMFPYHIQHTGVARFQYTDFAAQWRVPVPDREHQLAIAALLSSLDDKIELNRRTNETLEAMAQAIFRDWFVDFGPTRRKIDGATDPVEVMGGLVNDPDRARKLAALFPSELGEDGLPEGWSEGDLGHYAFLNPESWSVRNAPHAIEYVDLANTKWGTIELTTVYRWSDAPSRARRIVRGGDTIVGTVRPGNGSYSYVGIDGLTASTGFAALRPKEKTMAPLVYLAATSVENIERLDKLADGGAYPAVRPDVVLATNMPIVPLDIVDGFASVCAPLITKVEHNKKENRILAATRDLLLPKLMSGEIRLRDAERANEAVA